MKAHVVLGLSAIAALALSRAAVAGPTATLQDTYWGGLDTLYAASPSPANGDSVGGSPFLISGAQVTRNGDQLVVTIDTAYAGHSGLDSTSYGDLLLNPTWRAGNEAASNPTQFLGQLLSHWNCTATVCTDPLNASITTTPDAADAGDASVWNSYSTATKQAIENATTTQNMLGDTYQNGDWTYAITNGPDGLGLYKITSSNIVLSNVGSCSDTYPEDPTCGYYYRAGVAVQATGVTSAQFISAATMSVVNGQSITYTFNDEDILGDDFALSWAMTCANDVIQGTVNLAQVPEPIALTIIGAGLISLIWIRTWRRNATFALAQLRQRYLSRV